MTRPFKLVVFYVANEVSSIGSDDDARKTEETLEVVVQHQSTESPQDRHAPLVLEAKVATFSLTNEGIIGVYKHQLNPNGIELPTLIRAQLVRNGATRRIFPLTSGHPWFANMYTASDVSYWCLIRGRGEEMFIRAGKSLDELIMDSLTFESDKQLLVASRADLASYILEHLQDFLDGKVQGALANRNHRHGIRRILVRLCLDAGILPASLFLRDIKCTDLEPVGMGGYADIFLGTYAGSKVALKRLRVFLSGFGPQSHTSFFREALVWRHLQHPHVLQFLGIDQVTFKSHLSMVIPWMQYGDINHCMKLLEDTVDAIPHLRWVAEIAEGMAYLHEEHVVHADLRGANVLIDDHLSVRLSDFGLAQFADSTTASKGSHSGGTLRWMAPELLIDDKQPDYASDVYAFGCVCLEIYSQCRPFPSMNDAQVIAQVMRRQRPPRKIMKSGEPIPHRIWQLIENCWSEVKTRPNMREIVAILFSSMRSPDNEDSHRKLTVDSAAAPVSGASSALDFEVVGLVRNAYGSVLYKGLLLAARGDLADRILCTMQGTLDQYSAQGYDSRPEYFQFLRCVLLQLSSKSRSVPSSLLISGLKDLEISGSTGISDIYTAKYHGKKVALKRVRNSQSPHERSLFEALCRETLVWRQLRHPRILPFLGTCNIELNFELRLCLVSPWADRGNAVSCFWDMKSSLTDGQMTMLLDQWVVDIAHAVEYLHKERIVHADLRGGNVFIDGDMHAKLAHFNVSFFADELKYDDIAPQKQYGSEYLRWMAPELLEGDTQPTFSTDVYAFGCLCIEFFIGEEIYITLDKDIISKVLAQDERPPRPTGRGDTIAMSDDLWILVQSCWAKKSIRLTMSDVLVELSCIRPTCFDV